MSRKIILAANGKARREMAIEDIEVPDCWPIYECLKKEDCHGFAEKVLETWHLAHDLVKHLKGIAGDDAVKRVDAALKAFDDPYTD